MTKTFKLGGIFLVSVANLIIFRLIFNYINLSDNLSGWLFSVLFQGIGIGVIPYLLYRVWVKGDNRAWLKDMKITTRIAPISYLLAVGIGLLVFYINLGASSVWYTVLTLLGYDYASGVGTIYSGAEVLVFELLTSALLPAIFEELTNRGLLLAVLDDCKSDTKTVLIMGVFFGFLHQNVAQLGPTAFGGVVMAYMAVKCRSILPGMIVHFLNNGIITVLDYGQQMYALGKPGGAIGYVYNSFLDFYSNHFIIIAITWAVGVWLLCTLLHVFSKVNRPYRKDVEVVKEEQKAEEPQRTESYVQPGQYDPFYKIYGISATVANVKPIKETVVKLAVQTKHWWEYGLVYCAFFAALLTTIATFIWGRLR